MEEEARSAWREEEASPRGEEAGDGGGGVAAPMEEAGEVGEVRARRRAARGGGVAAPRGEEAGNGGGGEVRVEGRARSARSARPDPRGGGGGPRGTMFAGGRTKVGGENVAPKRCPLFSLFSCRRRVVSQLAN